MMNKNKWKPTKKEQEELHKKYNKFNKLIEKDDFWIKTYKELEKKSKVSLLKDIYFLLRSNKYHILGIESLTRFYTLYIEVFRRLLIEKNIATKNEINNILNIVYEEDVKRIKIGANKSKW